MSRPPDSPHDEALEYRVSALEHEIRDLRELVDGQESWTHRKRLHALENDHRARAQAAEALRIYTEARNKRSSHIRDWGAFVLGASSTIAVLLSHFLH